MAKIDFSTSQELKSLIEYCRIYNLSINDFTGDFISGKGNMRPDLQSSKYSIGIECTNSELSGLHRAMNDDRSPAFAYFTSFSSSPDRLIEIVTKKTEKLNKVTENNEELYKKYDTNVLFIKVPTEFYFSNCSEICSAISCKKATDCDSCTNTNKIGYVGDEDIVLKTVGFNCSRDDCKKHKICTVGEFAKALQKVSFIGEYKYNPIILSKEKYGYGENNNEYCCWIINTIDYTIIERRGQRSFLENERDTVEKAIKNTAK